jgi:hypothetical protein
LSAVASVSTKDFGEEQRADFGPVVDALRERGCPTQLFPVDSAENPSRRFSTKQRRRLSRITPGARRRAERRLGLDRSVD